VTGTHHPTPPSGPAVTVEDRGAVALLRLCRPHRANAMDAELAEALLAAVRAVRDGGARALVLTGDGRAFSAGGDIETIHAMRDDPQVRRNVLYVHQELFWTMARLPFPSVAAVNGAAVGAGVTVALLCDLVVMSDEAFFSDPRVSLGLLDGAGGFVLWPLLTSLSAAKEHLLLGDRVNGVEAHRVGLANRVVPTGEVVAELLRLAERLAALPAHATGQARRLLNTHLTRAATLLEDSAAAEYRCFETEEHRVLLEKLSRRVAGTDHGTAS